MTPKEAAKAVFERFQATWGDDPLTSGMPLMRQGARDEAPKDRTAWARIAVHGATGEQVSLGGSGGGLYRRDGTVHIQCFGRDAEEAHDMAEVAMRAFEDGGSSPWFYDVSYGPCRRDSHWLRINVTAGFAYHVTRAA